MIFLKHIIRSQNLRSRVVQFNMRYLYRKEIVSWRKDPQHDWFRRNSHFSHIRFSIVLNLLKISLIFFVRPYTFRVLTSPWKRRTLDVCIRNLDRFNSKDVTSWQVECGEVSCLLSMLLDHRVIRFKDLGAWPLQKIITIIVHYMF